MGMIRTEIELASGEDTLFAMRKIISEEEVKKITVTALVDSGSYYMAINERIQEYLQLPVIGKESQVLANGSIIWCDIVGYLHVRFQNKISVCKAIVLPAESEVLLGSIPMEDMYLIIDPQRQEVVVDVNFIPRV